VAGTAAAPLQISKSLECEIAGLICRPSQPLRIVVRGLIVCMAVDGLANAEIARRLNLSETTVRKWRNRVEEMQVVAALNDAHRSGRPAEVPLDVRCTLVKLACNCPKDVAFRNLWTLASLQDALEHETGWQLSTSEISRILRFEGIRPHRVRMWLHSPDPEFEPKVRRICDLYLNPPEGATVICVDEKPGMQAISRRYVTRYTPEGIRYEFEYKRHGTSTLLAAFNIETGELFGRIRRRTSDGLVSFMEELALEYPTGPVYVVWDNLNVHHDGPSKRWEKFNKRHGGRFHFVYTPIHASWVNQVEIWFSILQRRVLKYASFGSRASLSAKVASFIRYWNREEAHPFRWTFRGIDKKLPKAASPS